MSALLEKMHSKFATLEIVNRKSFCSDLPGHTYGHHVSLVGTYKLRLIEYHSTGMMLHKIELHDE